MTFSLPRMLIAALGLTVAALTISGSAQANSASQVERPGGTYQIISEIDDDPTVCKKLCEDDAKCVAYTYVRPGFQGRKNRCWLKDQITPTWKVEKDCCVSGVTRYDAATTQNFDAVSLTSEDGTAYGLDLCRAGGKDCGWSAAHAFCESKGFEKAVDYHVVRDMPPTKAIGDGFVCNTKFCHRITGVVCGSAQEVQAGE